MSDESVFRPAAEAGDSSAIRGLANELARQGRHDEAELWFERLNHQPAYDFQQIADGLADQGRPEEARRWLRRAVATGDMHALAWAGRYEARHGDAAAAEQWYRQAIEAGAEHAMVSLGRLLEDQGRLDEAETWLRAAPRVLGGEEVVAFLRRRGRFEEAEQQRDHMLAEERRSWDLYRDSPGVGALPDLPTVVTSVVISAAVLPFVQTLATKAAEDTYGAVRALLAKLVARNSRGEQPADSALLIVDDPAHGLALQLRTDETDEALRALAALEQTLKESRGRRGVRVAWDPVTRTWRSHSAS